MKGAIQISSLAVFLILAIQSASSYPYPQQQSVALPPHLLREYLARQQERNRQETPIYEQESQPSYTPAQAQQLRAQQGLVQRGSQPNYPQQYLAQQQQQQQPQQIQYVSPQPQQQAYRPKPQAARPRPIQQQDVEGELPEDYDPNPSYQFGFDVNDDQFTNYQNRQEERQGNVIKGSYSVVDSDGFIRTVTYTADPKEGFKAEVVRKPTDIVVKIPTPAPATEGHPLRHPQTAQYLEGSSQARPQQPQYYRYQQQQQQ